MKYKIEKTDTGFYAPYVRRWFKWVHLRSIHKSGSVKVYEEKGTLRCSLAKLEDAIEVVKTHAIGSSEYWNNQKLILIISL